MTEPRSARVTPRLAASSLELRLYVVAVIAGIYATVWLLVWRGAAAAPVASVEAPVTPPAPSSPAPVPATAPPRAAAVWLEEVPVPQRPALALPPGWRLASRRELSDLASAPRAGSTAPAPRVVRAPARRPLRLRTRSS